MTYGKLYRSRTNRWIAGICGGLGRHFGIDPIIIRLLLIVFAIAYGAGIILYIILWIVVEEEPAGAYDAYGSQPGYQAPPPGEPARSPPPQPASPPPSPPPPKDVSFEKKKDKAVSEPLRTKSPRVILNEQLARGEIDMETYKRLKKEIQESESKSDDGWVEA
jgi:phage shock protein C